MSRPRTERGRKPHVLFLTVDEIQFGVGASQVRDLLRVVAQHGCQITLLSFEKGVVDRDLQRQLREVGVRWRPLRFGRPGLLSGGLRILRLLILSLLVRRVDVVHARSDLPLLCALPRRRVKTVWDVRSLWAQQRVATGQLRAGGLAAYAALWFQRWGYKHADIVLTLTLKGREELRKLYGPTNAKFLQITTLVDTRKILGMRSVSISPLRIVLLGGESPYYDHETMAQLVRALKETRYTEFTWITRSVTSPALALVADRIFEASLEEVRETLFNYHLGLSVCRSDAGLSLAAAAPTKIGEYWASGVPIVVNEGLGDYGALLETKRVGVVLFGSAPGEIEAAVTLIDKMLEDPQVAMRCRNLAESYASLTNGAARVAAAYRSLVQ